MTFGDGKTAPMAVSLLPGQEFPLGTYRTECSNPPDMSCGATTARFSEPGSYLLRVVAVERTASNSVLKVTVTP